MRGVVAAGNPHTARAGAGILRRGGNAVDAAVAAAFASFVGETVVVSIGGGGFAVVVDRPLTGGPCRTRSYDFFSTMPSPAENMDFRRVLIDFGGEKQPFFIGRASSAVPGVVAGLCRMARERGSLPLKTLLEPAIELARGGFEITPIFAYVLQLLKPIYEDNPGIKNVFVPNGKCLKAGDVLKLPQLAHSLSRIADEGPDYFYRGAIAEAIERDHGRSGGLITRSDLAAYRVKTSEPLSIDYRQCRVLLPPPPSFGGVLIAFSLKLLETVPLNGLRFGSLPHLRTLALVMHLTSLARKTWEKSTDHGPAGLAAFLGSNHVEEYRKRLHACLNGAPLPELAPVPNAPGNTSHISVMDKDGCAVSITTSAGEAAGYLLEDTGVVLNNMLGEEDLNPDGFHRGVPGERLISMMSPVIVLRDNRPVLAVGSAGSNRIRSAIIQTVVNAIDLGLPLHEAINAPRIHFEGGLLQVEAGLSGSVAEELRLLGFKVNCWQQKNLFFGGAQAVSQLDGNLVGAADERRGGQVEYA